MQESLLQAFKFSHPSICCCNIVHACIHVTGLQKLHVYVNRCVSWKKATEIKFIQMFASYHMLQYYFKCNIRLWEHTFTAIYTLLFTFHLD